MLLCLLGAIGFWVEARLFHPFYVSMTEISLSEKHQAMEISMRIFSNDLEKELTHAQQIKTDLLNEKCYDENLEKIKKYVGKFFQVKGDKKTIDLYLVGFENKEESTWIYLEAKMKNRPREIEINSTLLYQTQKKQVNLFRLKTSTTDQTKKLEFPDSQIQFLLP